MNSIRKAVAAATALQSASRSLVFSACFVLTAFPLAPDFEYLTINTPRLWLRREIHAAQEVLKARVGTQRVREWIHFEINEWLTAILVSLFQLRECLVGIA